VDRCDKRGVANSTGDPLYWCHYVDRDCPRGMLETPCDATITDEGMREVDLMMSIGSCFEVGPSGVTPRYGSCGPH